MITLQDTPTGEAAAKPTPGPVVGGEFITPSLAELWPSPTNPRQRFDPDKLQQLADNIRAAGVHTPILIRALPQKYLAESAYLKPRPTYEIVAGERRYRASKLAGMAGIPALLRDLDDAQVVEIQLTENAQRDDLTALEEAEALARVLAETSIHKDDLGKRIGKSRTHVYNRLKLLDLIPDGCAALNAGKVNASIAEVVARIPDAKLQAQALKEATRSNYDDVPAHSYDSFKKWVRDNVMLALNKARFKITDASLVPAAGACGECPNRTGANPDLFSDVKSADICTNPTCFHEKEAAHDAAIVAKAAERGQTVITGREAKEIIPYEYNEDRSELEGYRRLDKPDTRTGSGKALKALLGDEVQPVLVQSPHSGKLIEVLPTSTVNQLLKQKELIDARQARARHDISPAQREREEKEDYERRWRMAAIEQLHPAMLGDMLPCDIPAPIARSIAGMLLGGLTQDERGHIAKVLGLGKVAALDGITSHLAKAEHGELMAGLLVVLMEHDTRNVMSYSAGYKPNPAARITAVADAVGFDLRAVQRKVRSALDDRVKAAKPTADGPKYRDPMTGATWTGRGKKPKWVEVKLADGHDLEEFAQASLPLASAAQASIAGGAKAPPANRPAARARAATPAKGKTSAQEAMQGIAAAMQGIEASAPADARPDDAAAASSTGDDLGDADAPQGKKAGPVADAQAPAASPASPAWPFNPEGQQQSGAVVVDGSLVDRAAAVVRREQKASVRLLKVELKIGHDTARLVLGKLEAKGVVGPCDERGTRKVLVAA